MLVKDEWDEVVTTTEEVNIGIYRCNCGFTTLEGEVLDEHLIAHIDKDEKSNYTVDPYYVTQETTSVVHHEPEYETVYHKEGHYETVTETEYVCSVCGEKKE